MRYTIFIVGTLLPWPKVVQKIRGAAKLAFRGRFVSAFT